MSATSSSKVYRINEIFYSLQGEGANCGRPAVFVRFSGCNLRCPFCDTDFAAATPMSSDDILRQISQFPSRFVVLTGGELVAAMIADAVVRVVPGVIGDEQSALSDCFQDDILAAPIYTRPADYKGWKVPEILLSGNEAKIRDWELEQAMERTRRLRPDLLDKDQNK